MKNPVINIITRTSNRPNYFKNCIKSVLKQDYDNINHIISVDNEASRKYVKQYKNIKIIDVKYTPKLHNEHAPYNLYLNDLMNEVKDGWIIVLDDDDAFIQKDAITCISKYMTDINNLLFWKVQFPHNTIPEHQYFGKKPVECHIDTMCYAFHKSMVGNTLFDDTQLGDFNFISEMYNKENNKIYIDKVFITLQRNDAGGRGLRDDL